MERRVVLKLKWVLASACLVSSVGWGAGTAGPPVGLDILFEPHHGGILLPVEIPIPTSALEGTSGGWQLREADAVEAIPCQMSRSPLGQVLRFVVPARTYAQPSTRNFRLLPTAECPSTFKIADTGGGCLAVEENGKPVLAYNQTPRLEAGVAEKFRRSCYIHPIYDLDGTVLTDDFPEDHYHHRGLCWAWPHVRLAGEEKAYDVWALENAGQRFDRILGMEAGAVCARFGAVAGWYLNDRRVVHETAWLTIFRSDAFGRLVDFDLKFEAVDVPVTIGGREKKGYGGFTLRFGPREDTTLTTSSGDLGRDADHDRFHWADLSARLRGAQNASGATVFDHPENPGFPNTWCLRRYGIVSPTFPGEGKHEIKPGEPLRLRYRIWIHRGGADRTKIEAAYRAYTDPPKVRLVTH